MAICDASWSTGACILSSVVGAPKQERQQHQQQHILESRCTCFSSHIRTRYFSEGSVQQHPLPYSFRKRVIVRPVMTRLFFLGKPRKKRLASLARLMIIWCSRALRYIDHPAFLRALRCACLTVFCSFFFKSGVYPCLLAVFWYHKLWASYLRGLRLSSLRLQSTSTAPNSQQQEFDNKQQQHPPANSSTPNRPESISHLETVSPTRLHRVLRSRVNDYGNNWSQTDRLYRYN